MSSGLLLNKVEPWAFIRVKNERTTLLASLNSILPVIHKGVIAYNDCTDGSDKIIEKFCSENPGFIPFRYPYYVEPSGSQKYATDELDYKNTLAGYYNAALKIIPKNEWLIKIDVDQIYFASILEHSFYLPKHKNDIVFYSRLNLVKDKNNLLYVEQYLRPGDHWLVHNENIHFVNVYGHSKHGEFYSYELAKFNNISIPFKPECSSIHFPFEKKYRNFTGNTNSLMLFEDFLARADKSEFSVELLKIKDIVATFEK